MSNIAPNKKNVLVIENVSKVVTSPEGPLTILSNINFIVTQGESVAIVGASGAGKSTLLGLMAGLDIASSGNIFLNDQELTEMDEDDRAEVRAKNVGFVFQSFHLIPSLNALENVMLPLELNNKKSAKKHAQQILNELGLQARVQHYPHQLSGGEKQRVAIARAFAAEPSILFADEPTGNLDTKTGENIMNTMFELNRDIQTTLILVTHDSQLASKCNRKIVLDAGSLIEDSNI
ncbi:MAG: ABC transporter [Gammaproteobacteria bacterium]|jgi:putative ABC transport system ATP-binding protein|nr:ABC transporter [Gammaproteobacteria bacterium]